MKGQPCISAKLEQPHGLIKIIVSQVRVQVYICELILEEKFEAPQKNPTYPCRPYCNLDQKPSLKYSSIALLESNCHRGNLARYDNFIADHKMAF